MQTKQQSNLNAAQLMKSQTDQLKLAKCCIIDLNSEALKRIQFSESIIGKKVELIRCQFNKHRNCIKNWTKTNMTLLSELKNKLEERLQNKRIDTLKQKQLVLKKTVSLLKEKLCDTNKKWHELSQHIEKLKRNHLVIQHIVMLSSTKNSNEYKRNNCEL